MKQKVPGVILHVYTTEEELKNAKNGSSTIIAYCKESRINEARYHISVALDACDILPNGEVRVNLHVLRQSLDDVGKVVGEALSAEFMKAIERL